MFYMRIISTVEWPLRVLGFENIIRATIRMAMAMAMCGFMRGYVTGFWLLAQPPVMGRAQRERKARAAAKKVKDTVKVFDIEVGYIVKFLLVHCKKQEVREVKYRRAVECVAIRMEGRFGGVKWVTSERYHKTADSFEINCRICQYEHWDCTCEEKELTVAKGRTGRTLNMNTPEKPDQASYASSGKRPSVDGQNL